MAYPNAVLQPYSYTFFSGVGLLKTMGGSNMVIIITIVIASIVLLIIAAIIAVLLCKRRKPSEKCKLYKMILSNNVVVKVFNAQSCNNSHTNGYS